jgi:hypothetical protein
LAVDFFAAAFLAVDFLAVDFFAAAFLAVPFLAVDFLAAAMCSVPPIGCRTTLTAVHDVDCRGVEPPRIAPSRPRYGPLCPHRPTIESTLPDLGPGTARWLTSDEGLAAVAQATASLDAGRDELALASSLRRDGLDAERATAVMGAATSRRRARDRWEDADRLLFTPSALEQASDPEVSAWRARRLAGEEVWDLCAGVGGDALAIAATGATVHAVDLDAGRLELLAHNAAVRQLDIPTQVADALQLGLPAGAVMHADPGRRRDGRRVRRLAHHLPGVGALLEVHASARSRVVVLSPAVDLADPDLPDDAELEFVQVGDDLLESVLWLGAARRGEGPRDRDPAALR